MEEMNIPGQLQMIAEQMCGDYCKWQEVYLGKYKDPEDAMEVMRYEKCIACPMTKLV